MLEELLTALTPLDWVYRFSVAGWRYWFGEEGGAMFDYMIVMYGQRTAASLPPGFRYRHLERRSSVAEFSYSRILHFLGYTWCC